MATTTIAHFRRSVEDRVATVKKLAAFHIWNGVTAKNPVDTGRSRAAWNIAIGSADLSVPAEPKKGGLVAHPGVPPAIGFIPTGADVVVSNNVVYIGELEKGHSKQAPNGFVALTVRETLAAFDGIAADVRTRAEQGGLL